MAHAGLADDLRETLAVFDAVADPGEPLTTDEVVDTLGVSRRSASDRLERLVDRGLLRTKQPTDGGRVWYRPIGTTGDGTVASSTDHWRARGRELAQYETLARTASDVIVTIDTDSIVRSVNPAVTDVFGYDPDTLVGQSLTMLMPERLHTRHAAGLDRYLDTGDRALDWEYVELPGRRADGTEIPLAVSFSEYEFEGEHYFTGIIRDDSERTEREQELARQRTTLEERERALSRAYEVITDPDRSFSEQMDDLLAVVSETIGTDYGTLSRVQGDEYVFESVAAPDGADLQVGDSVDLSWTNCERVVESEQTLVLNDVETDAPDLADRPGNADWGISCYLGSPVFVGDELYGTFCFYDKEARAQDFTDWEVAFVDLLGNWASSELERQQYTERITALNTLNAAVHEVSKAIVEQSTREEIERVACEQLVAADSYEFAWIAELDPVTDEITPRAEAGIENVLERLDITADPDDQAGQGPAGTTFRTGELVVSRDVFEDPSFEPWREDAEEYGFQSFAAIPISHEGTLYGVLGVYADRSGAFAETERNVLEQLGQQIGHAIAAVERKRALMGEELVELEFQVQRPFDEESVDLPADGAVTLGRTVPIGGDEYLVYGTAVGTASETLEAMVDAIPGWDEVQVNDDDGDFELRLSDSTIHARLAALGGYIESTVFDDEGVRMTLRLPTGVEVRRVIETVRELYPSAEMVKRRQITQERDVGERVESAFAEDLTERQRATLRAAYQAGFFEWPRDTSGEEVAESLDIAPPTFHQHLRKAQQKVFESLLSTTDE